MPSREGFSLCLIRAVNGETRVPLCLKEKRENYSWHSPQQSTLSLEPCEPSRMAKAHVEFSVLYV